MKSPLRRTSRRPRAGPLKAPATPEARPKASPTADGSLRAAAGAHGRGSSCAGADERELYAERRAAGLCGRCGGPASGASLCDSCAALGVGRDRKKRNAARRGRYVRLRARGLCTDCGEPAQGTARCEPCARRSYHSSGEHRGLPLYPPRYTVVELATGEDHGTWDSWEEVAMCLAFAKLSRHEVEIITDASPMTTITAWG